MLRAPGQARRGSCKCVELPARLRIATVVRGRQVRDQRGIGVHVHVAPQALVRCAEFVETKTQAIHAGIDLDPGGHLRVARQGVEQLELLEAVHHQLEARLRGGGELVGAEHAFEQQDAIGESGGAQREAFADPRDGETVGFGQRLRCGHDAVAVGVGLDHRHHAAVGRGAPDLAEVVAQGGGIDDRADQALALHGRPRLSCRSRRNRRARGSRSACTCRGTSGALRPWGRCAAW